MCQGAALVDNIITLVRYSKHPCHDENWFLFEELVVQNPDVGFFQPHPDRAPWHVQAVVNEVLINFWPHKLKGCFEGTRAMAGMTALRDLILQAKNEEPFDVVE
jgi:hypothetical protein